MPEFYGIKIGRVKELINPELPEIKVSGGGTDMVFLTDEDKYLHLGFETGYDKGDISKHLSYDARLIQRDGRDVTTVIIYTADVKTAPAGINSETLVYNPHIILMVDYDGDAIYAELNAKIATGQLLDDKDILNLLFLPLMHNTIPRGELAIKSVEMAKTIPDQAKQDACIAAAVAFANKYLNEDEEAKLMEVLNMLDLVDRLVMNKIKERDEERDTEIAKRALTLGHSVKSVVDLIDIDEDKVWRIRDELGIK